MFKKIFTGYLIIGLFALMLLFSVPNITGSQTRKSRFNADNDISLMSYDSQVTQFENLPNFDSGNSVDEIVYNISFYYNPVEYSTPDIIFNLTLYPYWYTDGDNYFIDYSLCLSAYKKSDDFSNFLIYDLLVEDLSDYNFNFFNLDLLSSSVTLEFQNDQDPVDLTFLVRLYNGSFFQSFSFYYSFSDTYEYYDLFDLGVGSFSNSITTNHIDSSIAMINSNEFIPYHILTSAQSCIDLLYTVEKNNFYYNEGFNTGNELGYDEGYDIGYNEGYNEGYNIGYDEGVEFVKNNSAFSGQFYVDNLSQYCTTILYDVGNSYADTDVNPFIEDWFDNGFRFRSLLYNAYDQLFLNDLLPIAPDEPNPTVFYFAFDNYIKSEDLDLTIYGFNKVILYDSNNNEYVFEIPRDFQQESYNLDITLNGLLIKRIAFYIDLNYHYDTVDDFYNNNVKPYIISNYVTDYIKGFNDGVNTKINEIIAKDREIKYLEERLENLSSGEFTLANLFWSIGSIPFETIKIIWNFEFLGVNLTQFFTGLITALMLVFLIKRFLFK